MEPLRQHSPVLFFLTDANDEVPKAITLDPGSPKFVSFSLEDTHFLFLFIEAEIDADLEEFESSSTDLSAVELNSHNILEGPFLENVTHSSEQFPSLSLLEVYLGSPDAFEFFYFLLSSFLLHSLGV